MKILYSIVLSLSIFCLFGTPKIQAQEQKAWTPELSFSLKGITETEISPNGRYVAYVVKEAKMTTSKSEYISQIHVASVDGSFDRQFTFGNSSCTSPRFSPDEMRLAFLSTRQGTEQVFMMWMNGGEARQITHALASVKKFKWSPDGSKIAYLMSDPETEEEKSQKSEKTDILIVDKHFKYNHIYVEGAFDNLATEHVVKQVTSGHMSVNDFDWSPDGSLIVFSHQPDPKLNTGIIHSDISLVSSDSGLIRKLIDWPGVDSNPMFSPNGKLIAFSSQGGKPEPIGLRDLYTVSVNGGKPFRLSLTPDRNASLVGWSPDGNSLFVSETIGTSAHLFAVKIKGDEMAVVTLNNRPWVDMNPGVTPEGSTGTFGKFSVAGKLWAVSFTYQETSKPEDVFYSELINYRPLKLSSLTKENNLPPVCPTVIIHWKSSDGKPSKACSLILPDMKRENDIH